MILYAVIGCSGALIDMLIYKLLCSRGVYYQYANLVSVHAGIFNNFIWNATVNYRVKKRHAVKFLRFYGVGLCGLGLSALLLYLLQGLLRLPDAINLAASHVFAGFHSGDMAVKALVVLFVVLAQFFINHYITFGRD